MWGPCSGEMVVSAAGEGGPCFLGRSPRQGLTSDGPSERCALHLEAL